MLMSGNDYRASLRKYKPVVYVDGRRVESVVDDAALAPGVNAVALTYDLALNEDVAAVMRAESNGRCINRMLAIPRSTQDLLNKLEAVRLVCQETGCAQRYLAGDALTGIHQATQRCDAEAGTKYHDSLKAYIEHVYDNDLTLGIAMTDAKGDRSLRPYAQANADSYVHRSE